MLIPREMKKRFNLQPHVNILAILAISPSDFFNRGSYIINDIIPGPDSSGISFSSISGIQEDSGIGTSGIVHPSPTTSPLPTSSNVTGRGGTKSDYRRSTMEYVDKNANSISNMDYGKPLRDDRLVHLIDKLQIDNGKQVERQAPAHNHIAAAAVAPALLLANHISAPVLSEKSQNSDAKTEVCISSLNLSINLLFSH